MLLNKNRLVTCAPQQPIKRFCPRETSSIQDCGSLPVSASSQWLREPQRGNRCLVCCFEGGITLGVQSKPTPPHGPPPNWWAQGTYPTWFRLRDNWSERRSRRHRSGAFHSFPVSRRYGKYMCHIVRMRASTTTSPRHVEGFIKAKAAGQRWGLRNQFSVGGWKLICKQVLFSQDWWFVEKFGRGFLL